MSTLEQKVADMRITYSVSNIKEDSLPSTDPFKWFKLWFEQAVANQDITEANAMTLATASKEGIPSARIVLLKGFSEKGFSFFTNHESEKGKQMTENPHAALLFYWGSLQMQIRITGLVERLTDEESTEYFHKRPFESQIGALVSQQTAVIPNQQYLEDKRIALTAQYEGKVVPKPDYWGGYLVKPLTFEFWCGKSGRLHDRIRFRKLIKGEEIDEKLTKKGDNGWLYELLSP